VSSASTWPSVLSTLAAGDDLAAPDAAWAMDQILTNQASAAQFGAFVMGLRAKGESPTEVQAFVETMLGHARLLDFGPAGSPPALDVVGTGGDQANTVNISTMAALVCAAARVPVVKCGNRAASSATGTADVLEALGVVIALEPELVVRSLDEAGIGFCFAQVHHPALRHVGPWRRELGVPTVFNILGPLTNPGRAGAALIGCANEALAPVMADVLCRRGVRALVVRGEDGLDEISTAAPTRVWDARGDQVTTTVIDPVDLGIARRSPELLREGTVPATPNCWLLRWRAEPPRGRMRSGSRRFAMRWRSTLRPHWWSMRLLGRKRRATRCRLPISPLPSRHCCR